MRTFALVLLCVPLVSAASHAQWGQAGAWELYFPDASDCSDAATAEHVRTYVQGFCNQVAASSYVMVTCSGETPTVVDHTTSDCSDAGTPRATPEQCSAGFSKVYCTRPAGPSGEWFYRTEGFETDSDGNAVDCYQANFRLASKSGACGERNLGSGVYEKITCRSGTGFDVLLNCDATCGTCDDPIANPFVNTVVCPFRDPTTQPPPPPNSAGCVTWNQATSINTGLVEPSDEDEDEDDGESCPAEVDWGATCTACKTAKTSAETELLTALTSEGAAAPTETQCASFEGFQETYAACMHAAGCCTEYGCDVTVGGSLDQAVTSVCPSLASAKVPACASEPGGGGDESSAARSTVSLPLALAATLIAALYASVS